VAIVDDHYLVREGVAHVLGLGDEVEVVSTCATSQELTSLLDREPVDVVLTDIRMPPGFGDEGIRMANDLRDARPDVAVLVVSQFAEPQYAVELLEHGSARRGYLLKDRLSEREELVRAIQQVAGGGTVIDPAVVELLLGSRSGGESGLGELTPREREILALVAEGLSNAAIADRLYLTKRAVEKHINSIFAKLRLGDEAQVSRRVKAALLYLAEG
jgi:DNA-binding NarL/FixJ family response regulator